MTEMETVPCDYCGDPNYLPLVRQTDIIHRTTDIFFSVVACNSCNLLYTNPRPTSQSIGKYYSSQYSFHSRIGGLKRVLDGLLVAVANSPLAYLFIPLRSLHRPLISRIVPKVADPVVQFAKYRGNRPMRILDIGCGSGLHAHHWGHDGSLDSYRKLGSVSGVEVDPKSREILSSMGIPSYANLEEVPASEKFDIIRMNWSLEHVHSPTRYFEFIRAHLLAGGRAFLNVPNMNGMIYKLCPDLLELPIHLYHFTPESFRAYLKKFGFKEVAFRSFSYPGMYAFAAAIHPYFKGFAGMTLLEAKTFQKVINCLPDDAGNDMLFEFEA